MLGLYLIVRGPLLQAQTPEGRILLTPEQANDAYLRAAEALKNAEEDAARLRRELARYQSDEKTN